MGHKGSPVKPQNFRTGRVGAREDSGVMGKQVKGLSPNLCPYSPALITVAQFSCIDISAMWSQVSFR